MAATFQIIGFKKSGKTAITEALTTELVAQGISVTVIKHDAHDAAMDVAGTDTARFSAAGAKQVVLQSANGLFIHLTDPETPSVEDLVDQLPQTTDVVLIEGYKPGPFPKLALLRDQDHRTDFAHVSDIAQFASLEQHPEAALNGQKAILDWLTSYFTKGGH